MLLLHAMTISSLSQETYKLLLKSEQDGFLDCNFFFSFFTEGLAKLSVIN